AARHRVVLDRVSGVVNDRTALLRVLDDRQSVLDHLCAVVQRLDHLPCGVGVLDALKVGGAGAGDLYASFLVGRGVDALDEDIVVRLVPDVDVGITVGDAQQPVAGADDLAGKDDLPALRHDLLDHETVVGGIPVSVDRNAVGAETDPGQRGVEFIGQRAGLGRRRERAVDVYRDSVGAALDEPVDVQVL